MYFEKIRNLISEQFDIEEDKITPETRFEEDLQADSLDLADMVCMLESEFQVDVNDERLTELKTVQDVVDYLENFSTNTENIDEDSSETDDANILEETDDSSSFSDIEETDFSDEE